jgi:hypothetical protein
MQQSNIYLGIYIIVYYFLLQKSECYSESGGMRSGDGDAVVVSWRRRKYRVTTLVFSFSLPIVQMFLC